ncbi:uncharacterized protein LOC106766177 [Vigna radiata var. radiata]|uniref:Uncharacterized protein LOC106766177 n=1 Tax=Vigna radiata var. radiata TaxID=3916 RepID=A0A1S3UK47_VIGRR|nr:uncharacterized protein LOC106766177 [Vigna radiata var. radiata]
MRAIGKDKYRGERKDTQGSPSSIKCYGCGERGHIKIDCTKNKRCEEKKEKKFPNKKKAYIAWEENDSSSSSSSDSDEEANLCLMADSDNAQSQFLTKKNKYIKEETIEVQGNCSAIMQKTLPPKFKDPRSFSIPCTIEDHDVGKALVDLGASINLMPLYMLKKISGLEVKPTRMVFQMTNRSITHPYGVVEDVVIQIVKLKFPMDFVVMEMGEDVEIPPILGRPFMKTAKVVIHMKEGILKLKDQDREVTFNVFDTGQPIQIK